MDHRIDVRRRHVMRVEGEQRGLSLPSCAGPSRSHYDVVEAVVVHVAGGDQDSSREREVERGEQCRCAFVAPLMICTVADPFAAVMMSGKPSPFTIAIRNGHAVRVRCVGSPRRTSPPFFITRAEAVFDVPETSTV